MSSDPTIDPLSDIEIVFTLERIETALEGANIPARGEVTNSSRKALTDFLLDLDYTSDWPRKLAQQVSSTWKSASEAQAAACTLNALVRLRAHDIAYEATMGVADPDIFSTLGRTMHKVAPEFSSALNEDQADQADVLLRLVISRTFGTDPADPSDTFFVDATAQAYTEIFNLSAKDALYKIHEGLIGMPEDATGFALVLSGADGMHKVWLREPSEHNIENVKEISRRFAVQLEGIDDIDDIDDEDMKRHILSATAILICSGLMPARFYSQTLSAVASLLNTKGMVVVTDLAADDEEEALEQGSFLMVGGEDPAEAYARIHILPEVRKFEELFDLFTEMKESFHDRLAAIADDLVDDA